MSAVEDEGELSAAGALAAIDALGDRPMVVLRHMAISVNADGSWCMTGQGGDWELMVEGEMMILRPGVLRIGEDLELRASPKA